MLIKLQILFLGVFFTYNYDESFNDISYMAILIC